MTTHYSPLLELTPNRVLAAVRRLEALVWQSAEPVEVFVTEASAKPVSLENARRLPLRRVRPGSSWGKLYDQRWCRLELPRRRGASAAPRYLEWRDQGEATLHVDGLPFYGFDVAHRRVALPQGAKELWVESWCCQSAIWHPKATGLSASGSVFEGVFLVGRDDLAWNTFHDLQCLADLMVHLRAAQAGGPVPDIAAVGPQPSVARVSPLYRRVLRLLDEAVDVFDRDGVAALQRSLRAAMAELRTERPLVRAVLTGHAHIDLVWLWPERVGEAKAVHTFATVNRLMSLYPEFRFAYSQPASYQAVARLQPRLHRAVLERLRERRWEPTGAMQVESDTQLPCGEALARSFLLGQEAFRELRGNPARLCWLPDVFGYSACLPQLMRLAGVPWFFTTKLTWSAINRFPFSSFVWRGNDGSEVLTHVTQETGYNACMQIDELRAGAEGHVQADIHPEYLQPMGFGDGGGGPTEEMCERTRRFAALRGVPATSWDHPEAFFDRLAPLRPRLPVYQGECYLEFHRGTYTTQAAVKAAYRAAERALQRSEAAAVLTGRDGAALAGAWRRLVFTQFHDCLPGSSIPDVYAEIVPELTALAERQESDARVWLGETDAEVRECAFNPLPVDQVLEVNGRFLRLPPLSGTPLDELLPVPVAPVQVSSGEITNGRVVVRIDLNGNLSHLAVDGQPVAFTGLAGRLISYADNPAAFDAWDIDRHTLALSSPVDTPATVALEGNAIVVTRAVGQHSRVSLRYWLVPGESVVRLTVRLDWQEPETLLKLHFPTAYSNEAVRCGAPFGSVLRSQTPGAAQAEAMWEMPVSRHVSVSDAGEREGFFAVSAAKYGVSCRAGDLAVTLVRSPKLVGYEAHRPSYPAGLSRHVVETEFSDLGEHTIELAFGRLRPDMPLHEHPAALADRLFTPPWRYRGRPLSTCLRAVRSQSLWPCWAKPEADGAWTLRLHEVLGRRGQAGIDCDEGWEITPVDLLGRPVGAPVAERRVSYRPYEIVSLRFSRAP